MVKLVVGAFVCTAFGARVHGSRVHKTTFSDDLHGFITNQLGKPHDEADRVTNLIDTHYPLTENTDDNRRMKASQFLQMEERALSALAAATNASATGGCQPLAELKCKSHVEWAYWSGKHDPEAGEWFYALPSTTGKSLGTASIEDFHRHFHCNEAGEKKCKAPPCGCSNPPCDQCKADSIFTPDLGNSKQCHSNTYCVGQSGDCCPNAEGQREACCDFKPEITLNSGKPHFEHRAHVPGEVLQRALHGGHFLGPLRSTTCSPVQVLSESSGMKIENCAPICENDASCQGFTYNNQKCTFFKQCTPVPSPDAKMVFVKNTEGMQPHWLPTKQVSGSSHHFFVVGDWGSESCPGKQSMHYVHKVATGSDKWKTDHNAQRTIAKNMGTVGAEVKPFQVVNAGDNFYWGGVLPTMLRGRGIHDRTSWVKGFENVYTHPTLNVPWLSVLGNHDYGGDGCMADVRSQFDYTIKDMLQKNRWKMPSAYYSHLVEFDDFTAEYFMLDTNIEDAYVGRHGGICKQTICLETMGRENVPYEDCKKWFRSMWSEQIEWYNNAIDASTADWKIVAMHHKPHGDVAKKIHPGVVRNGAQLMIGSHTHELAFFEKWTTAKIPLLVVGAGGGAQANPGCGGAIFCSGLHEYGFADVAISKKQMTVTLYNHDMEKKMVRNICKDASVQEKDCSRR